MPWCSPHCRTSHPEVEGDDVLADQPHRDQVDLDSLDWLNFLVRLHSTFGIDIPEADYGRLVTLTDVTDYAAARVTHEPPGTTRGGAAGDVRCRIRSALRVIASYSDVAATSRGRTGPLRPGESGGTDQFRGWFGASWSQGRPPASVVPRPTSSAAVTPSS